MAAEAYRKKVDTVQFAALMGGIAEAIAGGDANAINLASQAGANAAATSSIQSQAHRPAGAPAVPPMLDLSTIMLSRLTPAIRLR